MVRKTRCQTCLQRWVQVVQSTFECQEPSTAWCIGKRRWISSMEKPSSSSKVPSEGVQQLRKSQGNLQAKIPAASALSVPTGLEKFVHWLQHRWTVYGGTQSLQQAKHKIENGAKTTTGVLADWRAFPE